MPTIAFRVSPALHERFLKHCESRDVSTSDVLREAVERIVDHLDDRGCTGVSAALVPAVRRIQSGSGPRPVGFTTSGGEPIYARSPAQKMARKPK